MEKQTSNSIEIVSSSGTPLDLDLMLSMTHITGTPAVGDEIRHMETRRAFVIEKRIWAIEENGNTALMLLVKELTAG